MTRRKLVIEHNGKEYSGEIGTVERTFLGIEDHGIMTATITVSGGGWGISVGGWSLDHPVKDEETGRTYREGSAFGMDHVKAIMAVFGVSSWEDIKGRQIVVLFDKLYGMGVGLAHVIDESKVLIFSEHSEQWRERHPEPKEVPA